MEFTDMVPAKQVESRVATMKETNSLAAFTGHPENHAASEQPVVTVHLPSSANYDALMDLM